MLEKKDLFMEKIMFGEANPWGSRKGQARPALDIHGHLMSPAGGAAGTRMDVPG